MLKKIIIINVFLVLCCSVVLAKDNYLKLENLMKGELRAASFEVFTRTELKIRAVGAVNSYTDGLAAKAWIIDAVTRDKIWEMTERNTKGIGKEKPLREFDDLVKFIVSSPIIAAVFQGERAVEIIRQTMGVTDPSKASPGTIRGDFGLNVQMNLVHGSDSADNAEKEISLFFSPEEILDYLKEMDRWVTGS